jgi:L-rhamnose mutarotase
VQRIAFQLRIKGEKIDQYEEAHRHVWPELLEELERFGVTDYSIFRRRQRIFLYMHVQDFAPVTERLDASDVNQCWYLSMAPLFEPVPERERGETLALMREVFFMPGSCSLVEARGES